MSGSHVVWNVLDIPGDPQKASEGSFGLRPKFVISFIHSLIHSLTHSLTHSFIHSFTRSFILIHSFNCSRQAGVEVEAELRAGSSQPARAATFSGLL